MMKISIIYCIGFILLLSFTSFVAGQERKGIILSKNNEPVEFATIILLKDGHQTAAAISDSIGRFALHAEDGEYLLRIQNLTYKTIEKKIELTAKSTDLGTYRMEDAFVNMKEVVVTASTIRRDADRFVMQINNNLPAMINKDASEVLKLAPGVWVDDRGISINGAAGSKVFINDRELKLDATDLVSYLKNFQASDIARVEVVPQAGAEYSADSKGGVIRIILRKQQENGMNGNVTLQTSQSKNLSHYKPFTNINALYGKWTFNASASTDITPKSKNEMMEYRIYPVEKGNKFESVTTMKNKPFSAMGRLGTIYEVNEKNSIGGELEWWIKNNRPPSNSTTFAESNQITTLYSTSQYEQIEKNKNLTAIFNYIYKVDTLGSTLKTIVDYTGKKVTGDNDYHSVFEFAEVKIDSTYRNNSLSDYRILTTDLMLDKKMLNGMKYTTGLRYVRNMMSNETLYEGVYNNAWRPLEKYNYALDYTEDISAAYLTVAFKLKRFDFLTGLRGEYTHTKGKDKLDKQYMDIFPNLNLTYAFNSMKTFLLVGQYARNIQRPNFWHLNSNRIQYSDYSYYVGNPLLQPTYINRFSLTAVYKYRHTLTIGGNMHKYLIREVTKIDTENNEVKYVTPENHYSENHFFIALSSPLHLTKWLQLNTNLVGVKQDIRGKKSDSTMSHYLYFINTTANITLPKDFFFEVSYSGTSRLYSANSGIEPSHLFHAQIKKKLVDNRINMTLGVQNIFNHKTAYFANMDNYTSKSIGTYAWSARYIKLSIQYTFNSGKSFKKRAIESGLESEKERLEKTSGIN